MLRGVQLTLTAVQLIGLVDTKLIGAACAQIGMKIMKDQSAQTHEYL